MLMVFVSLANYSEQFLLSDEEREILTKLCIEHVDGRVPVITTVSHFSTDIALSRAKLVKSLRWRNADDDGSISRSTNEGNSTADI
jgi:dihydrodipicolinate synthase/N-acetylneuraminate lyase